MVYRIILALVIAVFAILSFVWHDFHLILPNLVLLTSILFFVFLQKQIKPKSPRMLLYVGSGVIILYTLLSIVLFFTKTSLSSTGWYLDVILVPLGLLLILFNFGGVRK